MPALRLSLDLTPAQLSSLQLFAIKSGFSRENPRKAWTSNEIKHAARYGMERLLVDYLRTKDLL